FAELVKESLLLGMAGTAMGLPLGLFIGHYGLPVAAEATALNFGMPVPSPDTEPRTWALLMGLLAGLAASILAAIMPAARMARKQPVAALTMRGRYAIEEPAGRSLVRLVSPALLVLTFGLIWGQLRTGYALLGNVATAACALGVWLISARVVATAGRFLPVLWGRVFGAAGYFAAGHLGEQARR